MAESAQHPSPKLSRYRSILQAQAKSDQQVADTPRDCSSEETPVRQQLSRTPSRYRRPAIMAAFLPSSCPPSKSGGRALSSVDADSIISSLNDEDYSRYSDPNSSISEFHAGYRSRSEENGRLFHPPIPEHEATAPVGDKPSQKARSSSQSSDPHMITTNDDIREAMVEYGNMRMKVEITPRATPTEIILNATKALPVRIQPQSTIVLESFRTVGVQRPVRMYENIARIMNSWDANDQHSFILLDLGTDSIESELTLAGAPTQPPTEMSWILHHSQKPGKWEKRIVTLHANGRMTVRKDMHKPQDAVRICHLSDFDIYRPSHEKSRTKIKPPEKFCFAVKSQQKTAVFESMLDFVHFFCTDDKSTAKSFYEAVQAWRSWYLVNVLEASEKQAFAQGQDNEQSSKTKRSADTPSAQVQPCQPSAAKHEFQSATRSNRFLSTSAPVEFAKSSNQFDTTVSPERRGGAILRPRRQFHSITNTAILTDDEPLANIGQKFSTSHSASVMREHGDIKPPLQQNELPQTSNPALNRVRPLHSHSQSRTLANPIALRSRPSIRTKEAPKPLVDLTPQYQPPPQHAKRGRAYIPDSTAAGGLIQNATSLDDPLGMPSKTDLRVGPRRSGGNQLRRFDSLSAVANASGKTSGSSGR